MKAEIQTKIQINATPEKVWQVLTNVEDYPHWNPFVKQLTGNLKVGERIKIKLPGMNFKPVIKEFSPERKFSWLGKLLFGGVFDGHHQFELISNEEGTLFIHKENFNGLLVKWFMKNKAEETSNGFKAMNIALKNRVEGL